MILPMKLVAPAVTVVYSMLMHTLFSAKPNRPQSTKRARCGKLGTFGCEQRSQASTTNAARLTLSVASGIGRISTKEKVTRGNEVAHEKTERPIAA